MMFSIGLRTQLGTLLLAADDDVWRETASLVAVILEKEQPLPLEKDVVRRDA